MVRGEGFDWEGAEDLTALSEEELRGRLEELIEEERSVSYRLQVLQGRIGLIRAEREFDRDDLDIADAGHAGRRLLPLEEA